MRRKLLNFYQVRFNVILLLIILGLVGLAWANRFMVDDAFISFRYADNLVRGKGLVWNSGERVEGYTNFLWTILMTIPLYGGFDPVSFSYALGLIFFFGSLVITYKLSLLVLGSRDLSLLTIVLLGTNYTFSSFATGGLETSLQACLFVASIYLCWKILDSPEGKIATLASLSCLLSAALLTRLDSTLLVLLVLPVTGYYLRQAGFSRPEKLRKVLALVLPLIVLVGGWLCWKLLYYGELLPNTFYAKVSSFSSWRVGIYYLYLFLASYWLLPFPLLLFLPLKKLWNKENRYVVMLLTIILIWSFYVIMIGGDFIEFRFMVPVLPFGFVVMTWLIWVYFQRNSIRLLLLLLILLGSIFHILTWGNIRYSGDIVEAKLQLQGHLKNEYEDWEQIGKVLGEAFNYDPEISIATSASGAIPYYSRLKTIDMLGLNDKWIARYGEVLSDTPGLIKIAPYNYLLARKVNLVIAHPLMERRSNLNPPLSMPKFLYISRAEKFPPGAQVIEIPINRSYKLVAIYLFRHPVIDEVIQRNNWKIYKLAGG